MLIWPFCSPDLSHIDNIWPIIKRKYIKGDHKLFSSWKPISGENGTKLQKLITSCPDVFKLFWKEEEMLHHAKHTPFPTILTPIVGVVVVVVFFTSIIFSRGHNNTVLLRANSEKNSRRNQGENGFNVIWICCLYVLMLYAQDICGPCPATYKGLKSEQKVLNSPSR